MKLSGKLPVLPITGNRDPGFSSRLAARFDHGAAAFHLEVEDRDTAFREARAPVGRIARCRRPGHSCRAVVLAGGRGTILVSLLAGRADRRKTGCSFSSTCRVARSRLKAGAIIENDDACIPLFL